MSRNGRYRQVRYRADRILRLNSNFISTEPGYLLSCHSDNLWPAQTDLESM